MIGAVVSGSCRQGGFVGIYGRLEPSVEIVGVFGLEQPRKPDVELVAYNTVDNGGFGRFVGPEGKGESQHISGSAVFRCIWKEVGVCGEKVPRASCGGSSIGFERVTV